MDESINVGIDNANNICDNADNSINNPNNGHRQEVVVNIDTQEITNTLKNINSNILSMNEKMEEEVVEDTKFYVSSKDGKKFLCDENNKKLDNYGVYKRALAHIDSGGKDCNLHPNFIEYMRKYIDHIDNGGTDKEFMDKNIYKSVDIRNLKFD